MSGVLTIKHTHVLLFSMYCTMYMYVHHVHWVGNSPQCRRSWWASARLLSIVLHSLTQNMRRLGKKKVKWKSTYRLSTDWKLLLKLGIVTHDGYEASAAQLLYSTVSGCSIKLLVWIFNTLSFFFIKRCHLLQSWAPEVVYSFYGSWSISCQEITAAQCWNTG